jgi:dihydroorotase
MQVHFREPGREDKETLETGSMAALAGGVTSVATMPNTNPVADNQTVIEFILKRAKEIDLINIYPTGSITKASGRRDAFGNKRTKKFRRNSDH